MVQRIPYRLLYFPGIYHTCIIPHRRYKHEVTGTSTSTAVFRVIQDFKGPAYPPTVSYLPAWGLFASRTYTRVLVCTCMYVFMISAGGFQRFLSLLSPCPFIFFLFLLRLPTCCAVLCCAGLCRATRVLRYYDTINRLFVLRML